jgi:DNA-binding beta-propeller fold protein YncE
LLVIRLPALGVTLAAMLVVAPPASAAVGLLDAFGTKGSGDGQFRYPSDLALDSAGNIYVADQDDQRIQKLAPDGRLLAKFGSGSLAEGQMAPGAFDDPSGVAVDPAGNVWVVENDNKRVQKLAPDGSPLLMFGGDAGFSDPRQLALAPSGDIYVTDLNGSVFRFASDGTLLGTFGQGLETPRGIAVDRAGDVLVADRDQFRVAVFSPTGDLLRTISRPLERGALYAMDVALDASGDIWVLTDGNGLMKFSPSGDLLATVFESLRGEDRPAYDAFGIVAEAGGSVLVADTQLGRILRYGEGGRVQGGSGGALISLRLSPRAFRAARRGPSISPRGGTTVTYALTAAARVRFSIRRAVRGTYRRVRGAFAHQGARGTNRFHFSGRVRGRPLRPGRYRLVATTPGAPAPARTGFRIVR